MRDAFEDPNPWTATQVAAWCGASSRTVHAWLVNGRLRGYRLPGRGDWRIPYADLLEFLRKNRMPEPKPLRAGSPRILVVDDDADVARRMASLLRGRGYEVSTAEDGFTAGARMSTLAPDLVLLDLQLRGLDAHGVIERIRTSPEFRKTRVLALSALPEPELSRARQAGADEVLAIPADPDVLTRHVDALLQRKNDSPSL